MTNPAGESNDGALRLDFDRRVMLQFRGSVVTSDAGLLAYRELDDVLGLSALASDVLADLRTGRNGRHALAGLFRQSVFGRLAGYEDVNDADRLRHDPAMRWIVGVNATSGAAASALLCELHLSSRELDKIPPRRRQGRMASGRTLSACRLYSHQHEPPGRARRCFLQQARNMRAMDQGRQGA